MEFTIADFKQVEGPVGEALFKKGVHDWLDGSNKSATKDDRVKTSVKYQVLCDDTAIIGVSKQENKATGEVQESTIKFKTQDMDNFFE